MSEEEAYATAGGQAQMDSVFGVEEKAHGGVIRQKYGLGSLVSSIFSAPKKILKSAKKILKSDLRQNGDALCGNGWIC